MYRDPEPNKNNRLMNPVGRDPGPKGFLVLVLALLSNGFFTGKERKRTNEGTHRQLDRVTRHTCKYDSTSNQNDKGQASEGMRWCGGGGQVCKRGIILSKHTRGGSAPD